MKRRRSHTRAREEASAVFHELAHAIPDWLLIPLAGIGALCILSTALLALALVRLKKLSRERPAAPVRDRVDLDEDIPKRDPIVPRERRFGEQGPTPTTGGDQERVAPS
jgi:hypothetical protein